MVRNSVIVISIQSELGENLSRGSNMFRILLFVITSLLASVDTLAETAEEKGLQIAVEAEHREKGFIDMQMDLDMNLRNKRGEQSARKLRMKILEVSDDGDKMLTTFDTPKDIKGTGLLTYSHKVGPDDQWLYLPALKRVKRIASKNKSGPFVGSEFAFEDLSSQEVEKYTYLYLRDEILNGRDCYVIERVPVDKYSGYTRQIVWMDKDEYRTWKVDFYDRKNSLLKTLTFQGYQIYIEKFWRSDSMMMINHQTDKSTELVWSNYRFATGMKEQDFTRNSLQRAR